MLRLKCNCGKTLDVGQSQCSLCAMGFAPGRQVDMSVSHQSGLNVAGRDDCGLNCPRCQARLSFSEVARSMCSHCHATVHETLIPVRANRGSKNANRSAAERQTLVKLWPDKAPTR